MQTIPLQKAIEQAKANPNSDFATKLRQAIESGKLDQAAQKQGVDLTKFGRPAPQTTERKPFLSETVADVKQFGKDFMSSTEKRAENIAEVQQSFQKGEVSPVRGTLQIAGQLAGAGADAIGNLFKAGVKTLLPQVAENKLKEVANNLGEEIAKRPEVQSAVNWYSNLDENQKRDIDAVGGVVSLVSEFIGAGTAKRAAQQGMNIVKEGAETTLKNVDNIVLRTKKLIPTEVPGKSFVKDLAEDVIPTRADVRDRLIARSLKLAPVEDIARIEQKTGQKIGDFMSRNNLIAKNKTETVENLAKFQKENFDTVRDAIALVDDKFTFQDVPALNDVIDTLITDLKPRKSAIYQNQLEILQSIKNSGEFDLSQVQYIKNLFDDIESLYKRSGEVKDAIGSQDKANLISDVRRFIEDRVSEKYPEIDIKGLNNNVQTSREIYDAVAKRAAKGDTQSLASLGDYAVLGIGNQVTPGAGLGLLLGKKVIESSAVQLRIARKISNKIKNVEGMTPEKLKEIKDLIRSELSKELEIKDLSTKSQ